MSPRSSGPCCEPRSITKRPRKMPRATTRCSSPARFEASLEDPCCHLTQTRPCHPLLTSFSLVLAYPSQVLFRSLPEKIAINANEAHIELLQVFGAPALVLALQYPQPGPRMRSETQGRVTCTCTAAVFTSRKQPGPQQL